MKNLDAVPVFVKVVEEGGFTNAARALGLPKSSVSRQIARLESELSARLLHRTTRTVKPTEVGQAFYERCVRIVADLEEAELAVTNMQDEPRGTLRVTGPVTFGYLFLSGLVAEFMEHWPDLAVDLQLNDRRVDIVDEGYDVAIRVASQLDDSSLIAKRLCGADRACVGSPAYLRTYGRPETVDDLATHSCLRYTYERTSGWRFGDRVIDVDGRLVSNNGDVLRAAAAAGVGLAYLPTFIIAEELRSGRLEAVLTDVEERFGGVYALYPHSRHLSAKVRVFVDFAADYLKRHFEGR